MDIPDEILKIRDVILGTVPTEKIYLFGSYAYGTPTENSDYDFYVVISDGIIRPLDAVGNIYMAMRGMKRKPTDILAGTVETFERRSKQSTLERTIAEKGVVLYERREQSL
ncbi:MAG: nucleotidyltransferase domain-containing protein [Peptococcaceae bacterium]|nr:nucleotidyltransferase domain-containing protein [Peptococcaceae bacterium]